jgi:hypothetical protein
VRRFRSSIAITDHFQESKQDVLALSDEDDPDALVAMLRFCYGDRAYKLPKFGKNTANQDIAMYQLADLYDIPDLRKEATGRLIESLRPFQGGDRELLMSNKTVRAIKRVLGPDTDSFADKSIQQSVYAYVVENVKPFFKNALFRSSLAEGSLFNESFNRQFTDKIGDVISGTYLRVSSRLSYAPWSPPRSISGHSIEEQW